jgi:hypothetical protein
MNSFDQILFNQAVQKYEQGEFINSFNMLDNLCYKYLNTTLLSETIIRLFFCYETSCSAIHIVNKYEYKLHEYISVLSNYFHEEKTLHNAKKLYAFVLLRNKRYKECFDYMKYIQPVYVGDAIQKNVNKIHPDNIGYFQEGDKNKTLFVYMSGGIGDKIMYLRFFRKICEVNTNNQIVLLIDDNLNWICQHIYKDIVNLQIILFSMRQFLPPYDYHTNITMLMHYLGVEYETLPENMDYFLSEIPENAVSFQKVSKVILQTRMNIVINWHGNRVNINEKYNRGIDLLDLVPLFEGLSGINWISVQKEVTPEEHVILKKYNIKDLSSWIDNDGDAYKDTICLLKSVDLVISTDTSLVHIAGTMGNVRCWVLLTAGCDWRWTHDDASLWYPKLKLLRQKRIGEWNPVVKKLLKALGIIVSNKNISI